MTLFLLGIVATLAAEVVGLGALRLARRGPINIVGGVLLPHPSDERWKRVEHHVYAVGQSVYFEIGPVRVYRNCHVYVDGVMVAGTKRYGQAVSRCYVERRALEAV